ncbi:putative Zinc finger protein, partial [Naja naja]
MLCSREEGGVGERRPLTASYWYRCQSKAGRRRFGEKLLSLLCALRPGGMARSQDLAVEGRKGHQDYILEPLSLPESPCGISAEEESPTVPCLFCKEYYPISEQNQILKHMIIKHKFVIADVKLIADFRRYVLYWKKRFTEQTITDFCCIIRTNSEAALEDQDNYFLLCDALPEDRELREKLQQQRL